VFRLMMRRPLLWAFALFFLWFVFVLPDPLFPQNYSRVLFDREGELLGAVLARDEQWRFPPGGIIPEKYRLALLEFEDKRFFSHPGVDFLALARALQDNLSRGEIVSGASTVTMQVIRLSRKNPPRTIGEKLLEVLLALRLELTNSKDSILEYYAAHAPFGGNVVGLEAACWRFFGRPPQQLTWAESALLAVLPNSPGLFHVSRGREELQNKRNTLLNRLFEKGHMDQFTLELSLLEPLPEEPQPLPFFVPHLLFSRQITGPGHSGRLETTLDGSLQRQMLTVAQKHYKRNAQNEVENLGILVVHVPSRSVAAYVGNSWFGGELQGDNAFVDVVQAPRSTGSLLKPLLYMSMLSEGSLLPTHLLADVPTRMGTFIPENHTRNYLGAVRAKEALTRSLNVPFARLLRDYGLGKFYFRLKDWGMRSLFRPVELYGITLILGGAEGSLWDLTSIYSSLAEQLNRATGVDPNTETQVRGNFFRPTLLQDNEAVSWSSSTVDPGALYLTMEDLLDVYRPDEEGAWREFLSTREVAWKTGTSFGLRDAWSIGVTPEYVVGVWVGNADGQGRPELSGSKAAAPLLFDTLNVLPDTSWFDRPYLDLVRVEVCKDSGYLPGPNCEETISILAPPRGSESLVCPYHQNHPPGCGASVPGGLQLLPSERNGQPEALCPALLPWNFTTSRITWTISPCRHGIRRPAQPE
jgi:penicillin-binding protein 1C